MGQKTNPIIFQTGKIKKWRHPFQEKKQLELAKFSENQIETQKFIKKYFKNNSLKICEYNLQYANNILTIFITYLPIKQIFAQKSSSKSITASSFKKYKLKKKKTFYFLKKALNIFNQKKFLEKKMVKLKFLSSVFTKNKIVKVLKIVKKLKFKNSLANKCLKNQRKKIKSKKARKKKYTWKKKWKKHKPKKQWLNYVDRKKEYLKAVLKKKRKTVLKRQQFKNSFLKIIKKQTDYVSKNSLENFNSSKVKNLHGMFSESFFKRMVKTIQFFNDTNSFKIIFNLKQINLNPLNNFTKSQFKVIKKSISQLRRFHKEKYFNEGLHNIFLFLRFPYFAEHFAEYLANEMQKHKRQHFFLNFIQKGLSLINKAKIHPFKNIKIQIKGRFNSAPRSKKRVLIIGKNLSIISVKSKINYYESTSFSNTGGTFGIKIWTNHTLEKNATRTKKSKT